MECPFTRRAEPLIIFNYGFSKTIFCVFMLQRDNDGSCQNSRRVKKNGLKGNIVNRAFFKLKVISLKELFTSQWQLSRIIF